MYDEQDTDRSSLTQARRNATARDSDIIGYTEAAALLGVAVGTLYAHVHHRRLPFLRLSRRCVRFSKKRLLEWLAAHAVEPVGEGAVRHGMV